MTTLIIFLISVIFYFAMYSYKCINVRRHQLKLYALKDKLHTYAKHGEIAKDDWVYRYLDTSITKSLGDFSHYNIWYAIYMRKKYSSDSNLNHFAVILNNRLQHNMAALDVYTSFGKIIGGYVIKRHIVLVFMTYLGFKYTQSSIRIMKKCKDSVRKSLNSLVINPELTTSAEFIDQKARKKSFHSEPIAVC